MRVERVSVHAFVLAGVNIASVLVGFWVYKSARPAPQVSVQVPVAATLSILALVVWSVAASRYLPERFRIQGMAELAGVYLGSMLWMPALLVPLHYVTQGYLTSFGNIAATWAFEVPVNLLAVFGAGAIPGRGEQRARFERGQ